MRKKMQIQQSMTQVRTGARPDLQHVTVWVDPSVRQKLETHLDQARDKMCAHIFIVPDVMSPGVSVKWLAALKGLCIMSIAAACQCDEPNGPWMQLKPSVRSSNEIVWATPKFVSMHPKLARILHHACSSTQSEWFFFRGLSEEEVIEELRKTRSKSKLRSTLKNLMVLGTVAERKKPVGEIMKLSHSIFDCNTFLNHIFKVETVYLAQAGLWDMW